MGISGNQRPTEGAALRPRDIQITRYRNPLSRCFFSLKVTIQTHVQRKLITVLDYKLLFLHSRGRHTHQNPVSFRVSFRTLINDTNNLSTLRVCRRLQVILCISLI